jgi:hypothetical protein
MDTADVQPVDEASASRILTGMTMLVGNVLTLAPVVFLFAGLALAAGAAYLAFAADPSESGEPPLGPAAAVLLIVLGVVVAAASAYWGLRNTTKLGNWYLRRLARREIRSRPDAYVDPDDPGAVFVEIVPRRNWGRLMLETATDVGFLLVDETRQEILFEGDLDRMRIPAGAILSCSAEGTVTGEGAPGGVEYYFTVIRFRHPSGTWELPIAYRGDFGQLGAETRRRRAVALRDRVRRLTE